MAGEGDPVSHATPGSGLQSLLKPLSLHLRSWLRVLREGAAVTPAFEPSSSRKGRGQGRKIRLPSPCATFNPFPVSFEQSSRGLCVLLAPALVLVLGLLALVGKSEGITVSGVRAIHPQTATKPSETSACCIEVVPWSRVAWTLPPTERCLLRQEP